MSTIFTGMVFLLVDSTIPQKRLQLITNIIQTHNGKAIALSTQAIGEVHKYIDRFIVLVDSHISEKTFKQILQTDSIDKYNVVLIDYISECVKAKSKLATSDYLWEPLKLSQVTKSLEPTNKSAGIKRSAVEAKLESIIPAKVYKTENNTMENKDTVVQYPKIDKEKNNEILQNIIAQIDDCDESEEETSEVAQPKIFNKDSDLKGTLLEGIKDYNKLKMSKVASIIVPTIDPARDLQNEKYWDQKKSNFLVSQVSTLNNKNEHITKELERLQNIYEAENDRGRFLGYRKAINALKVFPDAINDSKQLVHVKGIGSKIRDKICEIIRTGTLKRAVFLEQDEKIQIITKFTKIYGVGPQLANKIYQYGCRSIDDIKKHPEILTPIQLIGLKYYEELNEKMKSEEVAQITAKVNEACLSIAEPKSFKLECCGSYRRGRKLCGDADIIITRNDEYPLIKFLKQITNILTEIKFLTDHLSENHQSHHGSVTYMGICQLSPESKHRRIDIKIYPKEQYGFAILYFTGSANFNRSMRLFARNKGFSLGDYGLMPALRVNNERVWTGETIPCFTEEDVFRELHLDYKKPEDRDV